MLRYWYIPFAGWALFEALTLKAALNPIFDKMAETAALVQAIAEKLV